VILEDGVSLGEITPGIEEAIAHEFDHLDEFCMGLARGDINIR